MRAPYRIGIDIGTNSLGWCLVQLDSAGKPCGIIDLGVRIFRDARNPKSRESLAADRRLARAIRRQRDRRLRRKRRLIKVLVKHGLMPEDPIERRRLCTDSKEAGTKAPDPYELRARGLDERLEPYEFGRALFHLNQRRGFQSNLRTDRVSRASKEGSPKHAAKKLQSLLQGDDSSPSYRTLGELLYRAGLGPSVRATKVGGTEKLRRFRPTAIKAGSPAYDVYPLRAMYLAEFEALWDAQRRLGLELRNFEAAREETRRAIFDQRPLKPVPVGKCRFNSDDPRAPRALPIAQRFRMLQELNHLRWIDRNRQPHELTASQRARILSKLESNKKITFDEIRKELAEELGGSQIEFNFESELRQHLDGDRTAVELSNKRRFGARWWRLSLEERNEIVECLLAAQDEDELKRVALSEWKLTPDQADALLEADLPDGYSRLGRRAIRAMLPHLEAGKRYDEAARAAGFVHHVPHDGQLLEKLPYYGERLIAHTIEVPSASNPDERKYGRLPNPTVHVALNQLRRVVNEIIDRYGRPEEVVLEIARDLPMGAVDLRKHNKEQEENQRRNERLKEEIASLLRDAGASEREVADALRRNDAVLRMRLWKELGPVHDRCCIYSHPPRPIGIRALFSSEVQIDHILPWKETLDDSYANKTLCYAQANAVKRKRAPYDAFANHPDYDWQAILLRARNLPKNKRWRFAADAMERARNARRPGVPPELADQFTENDGFLARHLVDTRYIARVAREYLTAVCDPRRVWPVTGHVTGRLRAKWGLNDLLSSHNVSGGNDQRARKNRLDHRHHAIDAFVIACTDRSMLQQVATATDDGRTKAFESMPPPWSGFSLNELREKARQIVVSFRADHGSSGVDPVTGRTRTTGKFHNDTAYFPVGTAKGAALVRSRKSIADFATQEEVDAIPCPALRARLQAWIENETAMGKSLREACVSFTHETGIRKVRLTEPLTVIPIRDKKTGRIYKAYKGDSNERMEVWQLPNGSWVGQIITTFEANQPSLGSRRRPHPAARLVYELYIDDMIRIEDAALGERTMRIVKMSGQSVFLADHYEAGALKKRDAADNEVDPFKYLIRSVSTLQALKLRKLRVSPSGRVWDPGPPQ